MIGDESSSHLQDGPPLVRGFVKGVDWEERKRMMNAELYRGVQTFHDPNRFRHVLKFGARMHQRSWRNQLLIYLQRPSATLALGKGEWKKKYDVRIAADEFQQRFCGRSHEAINYVPADAYYEDSTEAWRD